LIFVISELGNSLQSRQGFIINSAREWIIPESLWGFNVGEEIKGILKESRQGFYK